MKPFKPVRPTRTPSADLNAPIERVISNDASVSLPTTKIIRSQGRLEDIIDITDGKPTEKPLRKPPAPSRKSLLSAWVNDDQSGSDEDTSREHVNFAEHKLPAPISALSHRSLDSLVQDKLKSDDRNPKRNVPLPIKRTNERVHANAYPQEKRTKVVSQQQSKKRKVATSPKPKPIPPKTPDSFFSVDAYVSYYAKLVESCIAGNVNSTLASLRQSKSVSLYEGCKIRY